MITDYIAAQNYTAIVEIGQENNAKALRYVQMNIWGDYRNEQRWYALSALEALASEFAVQYDEIYRNVIRRAVWAMADESGNVAPITWTRSLGHHFLTEFYLPFREDLRPGWPEPWALPER